MTKHLVHESERMSVWCYPKLGIVHHQVHGYCYEAPFRAALEEGSRALRKFHATAWLSDDRKGGALSRNDEEWCRMVWAPRLLDAGWRYWAVVRPQSAVGRLNVARLLAVYQALGVQAEVFSEPDAALTWLEQRRHELAPPNTPVVEVVRPQPTGANKPERSEWARPQSPLEAMVRLADGLRVPGERPSRRRESGMWPPIPRR